MFWRDPSISPADPLALEPKFCLAEVFVPLCIAGINLALILAGMNTLFLASMGVLLSSPLLYTLYKSKLRQLVSYKYGIGNTPSNPFRVSISLEINRGKGSDGQHECPARRPVQNDWKAIPPNRLANNILYWAQFNIPYATERKVRPKIKVSFCKEEAAYGRYHFRTKTIEVFYYNHETCEELVDTIIHEFIHHLQFVYVKNEIDIDLLVGKVSDQPFEDEARDVSKKYRRMCMRDLRLQ